MSVYFVQFGDSDIVKIGYADQPLKRLMTIKCGPSFPSKLLGFVEGDRKAEQQLHRQFRRHRIYGELFIRRDDLSVFIDGLSKPTPDCRKAKQPQRNWRELMTPDEAREVSDLDRLIADHVDARRALQDEARVIQNRASVRAGR